MEPRAPGRAVEQLAALISVTVMTWYMIPGHQRELAARRAMVWARRRAAVLAHRAGHAGMGDELAGRDPRPRYHLAGQASRARDWLGGRLEAMSP